MSQTQTIKSKPDVNLISFKFGLAWVVFTTLHFIAVVSSIWGASALVKLGVAVFYGIFFYVGYWLLKDHIKWWQQKQFFGHPKLQLSSITHVNNSVDFLIEGFKSVATEKPWSAQLVLKHLSADGLNDNPTWTNDWKSPAVPLTWLPDARGTATNVIASAKNLPIEPQPVYESDRRRRWYLQVNSTTSTTSNTNQWLFLLDKNLVDPLGLRIEPNN